MKNFKWMTMAAIALLLGGLFLSACDRKGKVIAVVNGENIYEAEMVSMINGLYGEEADVDDAAREGIYESLIYTRLISQEAERRGLEVSEKDIDENIAEIVKSNGLADEKEFYKQLDEAYGYTEDFVRNLIRNSLEEEKLYEAVIEETVPVKEAEVSAAFDQDPGKYRQVEVRQILVAVDDDTDDAAAKSQANALIFRLLKGEDFASLAKEYSDDTASAAAGGLLSGFFSREKSDYVAEFTAASVALAKGEFTRIPVKTAFGYHIIKAENVLSTFEEVREYIVEALYGTARTEAYQAFLDKLMEEGEIERKLTFETEAPADEEEPAFQTLQ